jgi:calcineurin-like phosphoesterase family protein
MSDSKFDLDLVTKNGRKPTFFTADWHIGHLNSIKFDNRPFKDLEEMHKKLISKYNAQVPHNGICYFLGDIATHNSELTKSILSQLNGTKVIIVGNHDKNYNSLYNIGFDVVLNNATIYIDGNRVSMSHCPLVGIFREDVSDMKGSVAGDNWHGESKHNAFVVPNEGQFHLHGHLHSPNSGKSERIVGRQFDVGIPSNGYKPVSTSEISSWISRTLAVEKGLVK